MALGLIVVIAACSGQKQEEAHDEHEGDHETPSTPAASIKPFEKVDASVKTQIQGFLKDYFALNAALIEDNREGAKSAARKLQATVVGFDMSNLEGPQMSFYHMQEKKLSAGLKGIAESADIEEARIELAGLSEGMYALVKAYQPNESALYYQFCPMAKNGTGATWLSNTREIVNPYMGQRMLKCGSTREEL